MKRHEVININESIGLKYFFKNLFSVCARAEHDHYGLGGGVGLYFNCNKNGSYKPVQYRGSMALCVDEWGNAVGDMVPIGTDLDC